MVLVSAPDIAQCYELHRNHERSDLLAEEGSDPDEDPDGEVVDSAPDPEASKC